MCENGVFNREGCERRQQLGAGQEAHSEQPGVQERAVGGQEQVHQDADQEGRAGGERGQEQEEDAAEGWSRSTKILSQILNI